MRPVTNSLNPFYPDVLGAITGGPRINMDALETAIGIHPKMAYINQPIEILIVMQNMVDQEMQIKIGIRLPNTDRKGNVVVMEAGKSQVTMKLGPGEVGVLRMPIIARPPTQPGKEFPIRVAIRYRVSDHNTPVRPPGGGSPPSVLSVSPFKLQVLREVPFIAHKWNESTDILTVYFDLVPKNIPGHPDPLPPRYESLWTQEEFRQEIRLVQQFVEPALEIVKPGPTGVLYLSFMDVVAERFAARDIPLHPGETRAIAKMLTYTIEDAPAREPDVIIEETRWFRMLCQALARDPELQDIERSELISKYTFEGVLYEAILLAFKIIRAKVKENLGTRDEQINYANRFMKWFAGHGDADLTYVYLPLVLGGISIARMVRGAYGESPWDVVDQLEEAYHGRRRLVSDEGEVVFNMLMGLMEEYRQKLRASRIERPER